MDLVTLTDLEGRRVRAELLPSRDERQLLRLEDGRTYALPEGTLAKQRTGDYYVHLKLSDLESLSKESAGGIEDNAVDHIEQLDEAVIPVAEERAVVRKRQVPGATVRVTKTVTADEHVVDEPLLSDDVQVERTQVNRTVDEPEPTRTEGDTIIIPLYEEVLVVEKRLLLTEEVRVTKRRVEKSEPQRVILRRETATVERFEPGERPEGGDTVKES